MLGNGGMTMRRLMLVLGLLCLSGCESDTAKIERLDVAHARASLRVFVFEGKVEAAACCGYMDSLVVARRELMLAQRDLNKFLR